MIFYEGRVELVFFIFFWEFKRFNYIFVDCFYKGIFIKKLLNFLVVYLGCLI